MSYRVEYTEESKADLEKFDESQARQIRLVIDRVSENPLPKNEGGYGTPLGNKHGNLTGLCRIKLLKLGIRVVYKVIRDGKLMKIIVIAARADDKIYEIASKRNSKGRGQPIQK